MIVSEQIVILFSVESELNAKMRRLFNPGDSPHKHSCKACCQKRLVSLPQDAIILRELVSLYFYWKWNLSFSYPPNADDVDCSCEQSVLDQLLTSSGSLTPPLPTSGISSGRPPLPADAGAHTLVDSPNPLSPPFNHEASYVIDVRPPSMSTSSASSDRSESPITIDRHRHFSFCNDRFA